MTSAPTSAARRTTSGGGILTVLVGAALVGVAISQLTWYSVDSGTDTAGDGFTFGDLKANADQLVAPVASAYFDWLAWALVIGLAVAGLAANLPLPGRPVFRVAGFLFGVAGLTGTVYALAQLFDAQQTAGGSSHTVLHNSSVGLWAALAGFALAGLGAVRGSRGDG